MRDSFNFRARVTLVQVTFLTLHGVNWEIGCSRTGVNRTMAERGLCIRRSKWIRAALLATVFAMCVLLGICVLLNILKFTTGGQQGSLVLYLAGDSEALLVSLDASGCVGFTHLGRALTSKRGANVQWMRYDVVGRGTWRAIIPRYIVGHKSTAIQMHVVHFELLLLGLFLIMKRKLSQYVERSKKGRCVNCAYDLFGIRSDRCPECGYDRVWIRH
jgi:hypothetical protein